MVKKVAVIILNFKVKDLTLKCVQSVKNSDYKNIEIIVVDNNSGDGLTEEINKIKNVEFIQSSDNLGYTGGNNIGIKKALSGNADYIFILNPDTTIDKSCITNLADMLEKDLVDVVGPKVLFSDKKTIWYAGGILDKLNVLGSHRGIDEIDEGQYDQAMETDYVTGAAMMIKREVFNKVALFDNDYFLYYEDSDFCLRAKMAGFKVMYNPKAKVFHENAKSTGLGSPLQDYFITRNRMLFASKFLSFRIRFALLREALRNIGIPARRQALSDFLTGNFGKGSFLK